MLKIEGSDGSELGGLSMTLIKWDSFGDVETLQNRRRTAQADYGES
jgi:hypothetical protein